MIEELLAAAAVGASLGNAWVCALVSLSCSIDSRRAGVAFVAGRFLGLILLGSAIAAFGLVEGLSPVYFLLAFGVLTVALGIFVLLQVLTRHHWRRHGHSLFRLLHRGGRRHGSDLSLADGGDVTLGTDSGAKAAYVFGLGVARGVTPCVKIMVLAPLLISVDFSLAIGMVLLFAIASTIYPIIGFLSGSILRRWKRGEVYVRLGAALLMIVLGVYFVVSAFVGVHGGQ